MKLNLLVNEFLTFLNLNREEPSLDYLNRLVNNHQKKVKWETLSKIIDWEVGRKTGQYLPPLDIYVDRITTKGMGGTCWSHSVGFHWLLSQLGFSVDFIYMEPGHLCLQAHLDDTAYYIDVGYCAPLFQTYPMFQSFTVVNEVETFDYRVTNESIEIVRNPGPKKTLDPNPVSIKDMEPFIQKSNKWNASSFLNDIQIFGYVYGVPTSIKNNVLKQYYPEGKQVQHLDDGEIENWAVEKFGMDRNLYTKALNIYNRQMNNYKKDRSSLLNH